MPDPIDLAAMVRQHLTPPQHRCPTCGRDASTALELARLREVNRDLLAFARECARADSDCGEGVRAAAKAAIAKAQQ